MNEATREFIESHLHDDIRQLALKKMPTDVDKLLALSQIEARQILSKKVPSWASNPDLIFPKHLSLEQCSSELTAGYKKTIITRQMMCVQTRHAASPQSDNDNSSTTFVDLTGGLGIDSFFLSEKFQNAYYVENQKELCDLAENNFNILGRKINVINKDAESFLNEISSNSCDSWCKNSCNSCDSWCENSCNSCDSWCKISCNSCDSWCKNSCDLCDSWCKNSCDSWCKNSCGSWCIFVDPSRRDGFNRKMVSLHDCSPDVVELQEKMLSVAEHVLIKASPMLDISLICNELKNIKEIHVVSVKNECKEILILLERGFSDKIKFVCVNIGCPVISNEVRNLIEKKENTAFTFSEDDEKSAVPTYASAIKKYLYEPNSSLMKAGVFKLVSQRFNIDKLHVNSHLYTSDNLIPDFPGRVFEVVGFSNFDKKVKKELLKDVKKASVATRNFPLSANDLRKNLGLQESDDDFVFGTTMKDGKKIIVLCKKS